MRSQEFIFLTSPMLHDSVRVKVHIRRRDGTLDCIGKLHLSVTRWQALAEALEAGARTTPRIVVTLPKATRPG